MFGKKRSEPLPRGKGAAAAKQMGLFLGMDPEDMMTMAAEEGLDDPELEAELAAITGGKAATVAGGKAKHKGRSPLPMEDIAKMADECMRDVDEDEDDDNVEDDEDLLAELEEVVGEDGGEPEVVSSSSAVAAVESSVQEMSVPPVAAVPGSVQHTLEERLTMYMTALHTAKTAGEGAKARRLQRGLKTLESMLAAVKKGRQVTEAEIPPPVATGTKSATTRAAPALVTPPEIITPDGEEEEQHSSTSPPTLAVEPSQEQADPSQEQADPSQEQADPSQEQANPSQEQANPSQEQANPSQEQTVPSTEQADTSPTPNTDTSERVATLLRQRQQEYKMAALAAKKAGEVQQAMVYFRTSKKFNSVIEALKQGQAVDLSGLPPPPGTGGSAASVKQDAQVPQPAAAAPAPPAPRDALEALEQRRAKYAEASAQAKVGGDERKARMHDRIAKQYQSAIRAHKAGKTVNFDELPVPPGFPPIPGQKATTAEQGLFAALEAASKISTTDDDAGSADEEEEKEVEPKKSTLSVPAASRGQRRSPSASRGQRRSPSASPERTSARDLSPAAAQQLEFLEGRRKQYMKAALHAKQKNDMEQAKSFLRTAKGLEAMVEAARSGKAVDVSSVPSPPGDEEEDFVLVHHSDVGLSEKAEQLYSQLIKILKEQHEKCLTYSKQFTHLGNITETTKFEKMAESCKKSMEVLKISQAKGLPPPKHHFEDRTFHTVRMFPDLSSTEMVVVIVKGMNLPAPSGIQTNDLDAYVKFDFPYPSTEQPQRHKTNVIKNTNCPEYNQSFSLSINRNHRGFRRVVTSKGLKLELLHKGGFLRSDKPIGTAHVKLEQLESHSEIREIVEVMDGRKPTGGRVEVRVRLREPLNGQDTQASTERWLVVERSQLLV